MNSTAPSSPPNYSPSKTAVSARQTSTHGQSPLGAIRSFGLSSLSGTVYAEHANARDPYHGCAATPQHRWAWRPDSISRSCPTGSAARPRITPGPVHARPVRGPRRRGSPDRRPAPAATLCRRGRGGDPVFNPRSTPGLPRVPRCSRRCCSGTGSKNTATVLNTSATPPMSALAQVAQSPGSRQRSISPEHHLS
jgi:hypothetical protein